MLVRLAAFAAFGIVAAWVGLFIALEIELIVHLLTWIGHTIATDVGEHMAALNRRWQFARRRPH